MYQRLCLSGPDQLLLPYVVNCYTKFVDSNYWIAKNALSIIDRFHPKSRKIKIIADEIRIDSYLFNGKT